jgi:hypothetical protein
MSSSAELGEGRRSGAGYIWLWMPIAIILVAGVSLSIAAYFNAEPQLTIAEAIAAGFGGVAGLIVGLFGAAIGLAVGLVGAAVGLVAAGGALAVTLFIVGSPIIAIILFVLLMRRPKSACPDPAMH